MLTIRPYKFTIQKVLISFHTSATYIKNKTKYKDSQLPKGESTATYWTSEYNEYTSDNK
jgi:hypothetical protein